MGSGNSQLIRLTPGVTGQTASLHVETAMSAQAMVSASSAAGAMIARVDSDLAQRLDDRRVSGRPGLAADGPRLMSLGASLADEEDVHVGAEADP